MSQTYSNKFLPLNLHPEDVEKRKFTSIYVELQQVFTSEIPKGT